MSVGKAVVVSQSSLDLRGTIQRLKRCYSFVMKSLEVFWHYGSPNGSRSFEALVCFLLLNKDQLAQSHELHVRQAAALCRKMALIKSAMVMAV